MESSFYGIDWVDNFDKCVDANESFLECVIVETRCHINLEPVLKNMSCMIPYCAITIFHSKENEEYIKNIIYKNGPNKIKMILLDMKIIRPNDYSEFFCREKTWSILTSPKILTFNYDTGIRKNNILRFMEYDYVGAPWNHIIYGNRYIEMGNGGFCLRDRKRMYDICCKFKRNKNHFIGIEGEPDDTFFASKLINILDAKLPSREIASSFSIEHIYHPDTLGFHFAYKYISVEQWNSLFTEKNMDPNAKVQLKIIEAHILCESGSVYRDDMLARWFSLGISSNGFRISKGTYIDCIKNEIFYGQKKYICIDFENIVTGNKRIVEFQLVNNRCPIDIHLKNI